MLFGALFFVLAAEMGCTKQSLDYRKNEGFVRINLEWPEGKTPQGGRFYFYPQDVEGETEAFSVDCPADGYSGSLSPGKYKIIVYNSDAANVAIHDEKDYDKAEIVVLSEAEAAAAGSRAGGYIAQPGDLMLATAINEHEQGLLVVEYQTTTTVSASPALRVKKLRFLFTVDDASDVSLTGGTLSGVSPSLHCASASCAPTSEQVKFTVNASSGGTGYDFSAEISVLDLVQPSSGVHVLTLTLLRPDGTPYQVTRDLSATINDILNHNGGTIPVNTLVDIPVELKKIGNDLQINVGEWTQGTGGGTLE